MNSGEDIYERCLRLFRRTNPVPTKSSVSDLRYDVKVGAATVKHYLGDSFVIPIGGAQFTVFKRQIRPAVDEYHWVPRDPNQLELAEMRLML